MNFQQSAKPYLALLLLLLIGIPLCDHFLKKQKAETAIEVKVTAPSPLIVAK